MSIAKTFTVTVVSTGSGNKYVIDGVQQDTVMIGAGLTYKFDQSDSSNSTHPLRLYLHRYFHQLVLDSVPLACQPLGRLPGSQRTQ